MLFFIRLIFHNGNTYSVNTFLAHFHLWKSFSSLILQMPNSEQLLPVPWLNLAVPQLQPWSPFTVLFHLQLTNTFISALSITLAIWFSVSYFIYNCYVFKIERVYRRKKNYEHLSWKLLTLNFQTWVMTFYGKITRWTINP